MWKIKKCLILCLLLGNSAFSQHDWTQLGRLAAGDTTSIYNPLFWGDSRALKTDTVKCVAPVRVKFASGDSGAFVPDADIELINQLIISHDWQKNELNEVYQQNDILLQRIDNYKVIVAKMSNDSIFFQGIIKLQDEENVVCKDELDKERKKNKRLKGFTWMLGGTTVAVAAVAAVFVAISVLR